MQRAATSEGWKEQRQVGQVIQERPLAVGRRTVQVNKMRAVADHRTSFSNGGKHLPKDPEVGTDAFHPWVVLDLSDETCQKVSDVLRAVEVLGKCPATASCIIFCCRRR